MSTVANGEWQREEERYPKATVLSESTEYRRTGTFAGPSHLPTSSFSREWNLLRLFSNHPRSGRSYVCPAPASSYSNRAASARAATRPPSGDPVIPPPLLVASPACGPPKRKNPASDVKDLARLMNSL
jgi:hypothetical protein